ncbi:hypothetical protein EC957_003119 [Mortierella hygrophila]|uniref:Uncharacterized protein n=1 Tax=Mortierella hygrophila TaxID=979708 RepID=A0A9P6K0N6_9FUNG|nr:hypothetical protein EC957_003119 [Mortierella hygrophila]
MTLNDAPVPAATSLASMNRLQLQAACVKLGLESTPENELLRKQLREHEGYMQSHAHSSSATITTTTSFTTTITATVETEQDSVAHLPAGDTDVAMEDVLEVKTEESVVADIKVESEQEEEEKQEQQQQEQDIAEEAEAQHEAMVVDELSIKQEAMDEDVQESLPFQDPMLVEVKTEKDETGVVIKQEKDTSSSSSTITIKQEKEEETIVTIKLEKVDDKSPGDDVKKEDSPVPIAQRRQLWEARAAAPSQQRSGLPLSKARINNQFTNVAARRANSTTTTPQVQKRRRTADGEDDMDVSMEDNSSPTPPSGTVRKLIGRFAGSSIDAPSSVGKRRKVDLPTPKSSPGPGSSIGGSSFPSIPKFKRVVKIPVSSTRSGSSLYAMGNSASRSGSGTVGAKRRAAPDSANITTDRTSPGTTPAISASTAGATPKKASKPVSAETINRLATPKKINTPASTAALPNVAPVPAPNFGASTSTAPSTATVTKARGPVLSTAARAAQRQKK